MSKGKLTERDITILSKFFETEESLSNEERQQLPRLRKLVERLGKSWLPNEWQ